MQKSVIANVSVPVLAPLNNNFGFIYDAGITYQYQGIASRVLMGGEIISWPSPCGLNCSYTVSFVGPAYQCVDLGPLSSITLNLTKLEAEQGIIDNTAYLPPFINSSLLYYGLVDGGNETTPIGLWIVYDTLDHTVKCDLYNATYTANVSYINNALTVQNSLEFHNSINDAPTMDAEVQTAAEQGAVITDLDVWPSLNLYAMHAYTSYGLIGWIAVEGLHLIVATDVAFWRTVAEWTTTSTPFGTTVTLSFPDLATTIQDFMVNVTLSLIDLRNAVGDTTTYNFTSKPIIETITQATITSFPAVYAYSPSALWQIYAAALGLSILCVMLGSFMLYNNGVAGQLTFSQVLVTTRNPTLDKISEGAGLGGKYISDRVQKIQLRYGKVAGTDRVGFGMEDEIHSLRD